MTKRAWLALAGGLGIVTAMGAIATRAARPGPAYAEWRRASSAPVPFRESGVAVSDGGIYVFGGFRTVRIKATDAVQVYDPVADSWSRRRPMPVPVTHIMAAPDGSVLWFAGGFMGHNPGPTVGDVWRYDLATDTWERGPPLPVPASSGALVRVGRRLHFFGGYLGDRNTSTPDHWVLGLDSAADWVRAAPFPSPRGHLSAVELGGRIYAIGGAFQHDPDSHDLGLVQRYDPATDAWTEVAPLPHPLSHAEPGTFVDRGRIVSVGGRDNHPGRGEGPEVVRTMLAYDPAADLWLDLGQLPRPLAGPVAAVLGGRLVVAGGGLGDALVPLTETWTLPFRDAWHQRPPLPVPLGNATGGIIGRHLYLVGSGSPATLGYDLASGRWLPTDALTQRPYGGGFEAAEVWGRKLYLFGGHGAERRTQIYDPGADSWRLGADLPFPTAAGASAVIDGRIYVAGGFAGDSVTDHAAVYDPLADSWRLIAPMKHGREHAAGGTDGRRFFVFGGRARGRPSDPSIPNGLADVQVYDPAADRWISSDEPGVSLAPLPTGRDGMGRAVYFDGEFYVFGGEAWAGPKAGRRGVSGAVDIYDPRANRWRAGRPMPVPRHGFFPVAAAGWILLAGGTEHAGRGQSTVFDMYAPPERAPEASPPATSSVAEGRTP